MTRWSPEQVAAAAPSPRALAAARPLAAPSAWVRTGADERSLWGTCQGTSAEPYDTMVDHVGVGYSCSCPSRRVPCKHALALLLAWVDGHVSEAIAPPSVESWLQRRRQHRPADDSATPTDEASAVSDEPGEGRAGPVGVDDPAEPEGATSPVPPEPGSSIPDVPPPDPGRPDGGRDERVERMRAGFDELDRWLEDRMRTGLADPALAAYGTWDQLAARLVDARAGSLANRVRRLAGVVGASPDWHSDLLAEIGVLHLLAQAGRRLGTLPGATADAVATSVGWQVRQADVLAGVPETDAWVVAGRSDTREDRIEVRRHWLRGTTGGRWALVLSFAAYRQTLDTSLIVGAAIHADLHRYPGPALRALVGERTGDWQVGARPPAVSVHAACDEVGAMLVAEPWLDRVPFTVHASVRPVAAGWALGDDGGSLPLLRHDAGVATAGTQRSLAMLLAVSGASPVDVTCEWTPHGVVPLTIHTDDGAVDIGPRADPSFVASA